MLFFVVLDECKKNGNFDWFGKKNGLGPLGVKLSEFFFSTLSIERKK